MPRNGEIETWAAENKLRPWSAGLSGAVGSILPAAAVKFVGVIGAAVELIISLWSFVIFTEPFQEEKIKFNNDSFFLKKYKSKVQKAITIITLIW